jgi:ribose transport system substrate-binding protein
VVIGLAACSSSKSSAGGAANSGGSTTGSTTSSGTSSSSGDSGVQEAVSLVAGYSKPASSIPITQPVQGTVPTGKTVAIMVCGQPACDINFTYMTEAAKALGWNTKQYVAGPTPDKNKAAWDLVVQQQPDAVISIGFPQALWAQDSKKLAAKGIPVVECCTADTTGNGVIFVENGPEAGTQGGKEQADWVVADSKGKANAVYLNIPAFPILGVQAAGFKSELARLCPSCKYNQLDLNVADVGTPAEKQAIVGYLQSHPDVNYIAAGDDDSFQGVPAALSAAGLGSKLKAIGLAPSTANLNYIVNGQVEEATIGFPNPEISWASVDALARYFTKTPLAPVAGVVMPRLILTKDNISDPNTIPVSTPSYQQDFLKLWGKAS